MLPNGPPRNNKLYDDDILGLQERLEKGLLTSSSSGDTDNSPHDNGDSELELDKQNLWVVFQTAASSISTLYRESFQWDAEAAWTPFQAAALAVTNLYKESLLLSAKAYEVGKRNGQNKVTREILQHLRHSPKKIRRDEVMSVLSTRQRIRSSSSASPQNVMMASSSAEPSLAQTLEQEQLDLALFKDAVVSRGIPNESALLGAFPSVGLIRKRPSSVAFPLPATGTSPSRTRGSSSPQYANAVSGAPMNDVDFQTSQFDAQCKRQKPR